MVVEFVAAILTVIGVVLLGAGGITFWGAQRLYSQQNGEDAPRLDGGRVAVEGTAKRHEEVLHAPFSGHACLGYRWGVQKYSSGGHDADGEPGMGTSHGGGWSSVSWDSELAPFRLETDHETALVETDRVTIDLFSGNGFDHAIVVDSREDAPDRIREFADEHGIDLDDRRRYVEQYLDIDETAYVVGVARPASPSVQLPREVDAAIGPPEASGALDRLRQKLWPFSFRVTDAGTEKALRRPWIRGFLGIIGGLLVGGYGVFLLL